MFTGEIRRKATTMNRFGKRKNNNLLGVPVTRHRGVLFGSARVDRSVFLARSPGGSRITIMILLEKKNKKTTARRPCTGNGKPETHCRMLKTVHR